MPKVPKTDKEVLCHIVELHPTSPEYQEVEQAFSRSLGEVGTFHVGKSLPYRGILKDSAFSESKVVFPIYIARKRFIDRSNPKRHQNELRLFH